MAVSGVTTPQAQAETPARQTETAKAIGGSPAAGTPAAQAPTAGGSAAAQVPAAMETAMGRLEDILRSYGFKATEENRAMLAMLMDNGFPLTKENIARMNQALKLTESPEQALFLLLNKMRLTQSNADALKGFVDGSTKITEQISRLLAAVEGLDDPALKQRIIQLFENVGSANAEGARQTGQANQPAPAAAQTGQTQAATAQGPLAATQQSAAQGQPNAQPGQAAAAQQTNPQQAAQTQTTTAQPANEQAPTPAATTPQAAAPQAGQTANTSPANTPAQGQPGQAATPTGQPAQQGQAVQQGQAPTPAATTQTQPGQATAPSGQPAQPGPAATSQQPTQPANPQPAARPLSSAALATLLPEAEGADFTTHRAFSAEHAEAAPAQTARPPLSFRLADSTPQDVDRFINGLRSALAETRNALSQGQGDSPAAGSAAERVLREAQALSEHLDFTAQIKNQVFVQLPVFHNGQETQTALHVYKDAKKGARGEGGAASALIALETYGMGHFETYVQKQAQSVTCQFRLRDQNVERLVRAHIHELEGLLGQYRYALSAYSFLPPGEPYTLLDDPGAEAKPVTEHSIFEGKA